MNIFDNHLKEIENLVKKYKSHLSIDNIDNFKKSVILEVPPDKFNFDLSCNIAMVLGKSNKLNPKDLAQKLKKLSSCWCCPLKFITKKIQCSCRTFYQKFC